MRCAPALQPVFPDEILEEIFLRLDAAEDLARASAACTAFHRVVSARRFLGRFRCLHHPPVLGVLDLDAHGKFHPAEPPHRSAPAAQAADFTFSSFLGTHHHHCWQVCDARDSRVLLYRQTAMDAVFGELMVCDPLHRRHVQLPVIPDDVAAATDGWVGKFDTFLVPEEDMNNDKKDLSFRVICDVQCQHKLVIIQFSSVAGQWEGIKLNRTISLDYALVRFDMFERHYAHGCFFWTIGGVRSFMIMLNMHDLKLSVVDLPPGGDGSTQARAVVETGEGMIGLFTLCDGMLQLDYKSLQGTEWHHQRIIPLPKLNSEWNILDAAAGHLLLRATPRQAVRVSHYFTLNLKTFLVERLCVPNQNTTRAVLYASFLSPFSLPSI